MAAVTVNGDIVLSHDGKRLVFASGPEMARDRLYTAFNTGKGSYRFNTNFGFPWLEVMGLKGRNAISQVQSIFTTWLLRFSFIRSVEVVSVEYDSTTRSYAITFTAVSRYGRITDTFTFGVV